MISLVSSLKLLMWKNRGKQHRPSPQMQCEELPSKRCVLHFEFHCTFYQVHEICHGFLGQTAYRKTQAFSKNILPVFSWKIYTIQSSDFFSITGLLWNSPKLKPNPALGTWLPAYCWGKKTLLKKASTCQTAATSPFVKLFQYVKGESTAPLPRWPVWLTSDKQELTLVLQQWAHAGNFPTKLNLSLVHGGPRKSVSIISCLVARHLKEQKPNMFSYKNIFMCTMPSFAKKSKIPSWEKLFKGQSFTMCLKNMLWSPEPLTCLKKPQINYKIVTLGSFGTT